jgi:hypothetical protein
MEWLSSHYHSSNERSIVGNTDGLLNQKQVITLKLSGRSTFMKGAVIAQVAYSLVYGLTIQGLIPVGVKGLFFFSQQLSDWLLE